MAKTNKTMKRDALIIFIKNPEPGKVKTRLAKTVGPEKALQIYLALSEYTRKVALSMPVARLLFYSKFVDTNDAWPDQAFDKRLQVGEDLGERMDQSFREALTDHDRVLIIGSDCPGLTKEILEEAYSALDERPYVLGPAEDGGYYLLGMRKPSSYLFENMAWSTESVLSETLERIKATGETYHLLESLSDVDYEADWERLGWEL